MDVSKEADLQFFKSFDPFHYAHCALAIEASRAKFPDIRAVLADTGLEVEHPITSHFKERSEKSLEIHLHLLRLQQSEVLLSIMASNYRPPFARFISNLRYDQLNAMLDDVSRRQVPRGLEMKEGTVLLDFTQWIEAKLFGPFSVFENDQELTSQITDYICEEATLCKQRAIVNAYKHGCRVGSTAGEVKIANSDTGDPIAVIKIDRGVKWVRWTETKRSIELSVGLQEIKPDVDLQRIIYGATLLKCISELRLAAIEGGEHNITVSLPSPLKKTARPQSFITTMRVKLSAQNGPARLTA